MSRDGDLRALDAVGDTGGREVRDLEDHVARDGHGGGEGEDGVGELHFEGWLVDWLLVGWLSVELGN